ncbi:MAG TPA: hypothetical protein VHZ78_09955 [Rhizomicrobium sp.]|jgi:hypothetical protein|nr:hypothetical protein [Rhizomicrobium sp.]
MNRLPVGQIVRAAYAFTFGEIGTVIGLTWIPTAINAVGSFLVFQNYSAAMATDANGMPAMAGPQLALTFLYFFVAFLLMAMMAVAITRQALGLRQGPVFAHVSLGSAEWRVFGGLFGLYLLLMLFIVIFVIVVVLAAVAGGMAAKGNPAAALGVGVMVFVLGVAGFCALIYIFVRLSFLFVPSAVNDGEFGLTRSWELTKGNFWRIFAVGLAVLLPFFLVQGIAEYFILGPDYFAAFVASLRDPVHAAQQSAVEARIVQGRLPLLLGMGLILGPIMQSLLFSPAAFAYRVLSGKALTESQN